MKKPKLWILALVLPALVSFGVYLKVADGKTQFPCELDRSKWATAGLPSPDESETVFTRAFADEGALAISDIWAVELNCSSQEPAIGKLLKQYLTARPNRWPLLALTVWGLSSSEQHENRADSSARFAKIFSLPETESYFSKALIVSAAQKLKAGDLEYADALLAVTERKLEETDQSRLRAMVRSLEK